MNIIEAFYRSSQTKMYGEYILNGKKFIRCYHRELKNSKLKRGVSLSAMDLMKRNLFKTNPFFTSLINEADKVPEGRNIYDKLRHVK